MRVEGRKEGGEEPKEAGEPKEEGKPEEEGEPKGKVLPHLFGS